MVNVCIYTNVNFTQDANGCRTGCRNSNDLIVSEGSTIKVLAIFYCSYNTIQIN